MRSLAEIRFRLAQEAGNALAFCFAPKLPPLPEPPGVKSFPPPETVAGALRGTPWARRLIEVAEGILTRRFPLLGYTIDTGRDVRWRRDPVHKIESPPSYFRMLPYLDAARVGDHKIVWELNRHQHLVTLAQAWTLTDRPEFREEIARLLDSWFEQNPYGRGINWASALEVAFRALSWMWIDHLAGAALPAELRARLQRGLYQSACHIERNLSIYFSPNTHLLGEALALAAIGDYFAALPPGRRWAKLGRRLMEQQLRVQVRADGSHFEQSTYYHVYALDMFLFYAILNGGPSVELENVLRKMAEYLWALLGPTGEFPCLGDDDGGRLFHPWGNRRAFGRATLALAAVLLDEPAWPCDPEDLVDMAVWWLGPRVLERAHPGWKSWQGARLFADAGVAVIAQGDEHSVADTRAFGWARAGHAHAHALSIVHRSGAREILIDPGIYTYVEPRWRDYFRGTAAHNTVCVDGQDQATPGGPFAWRDFPETGVLAWNAEAPFLKAFCRYRGVTHARTIRWISPGRILIVDDLEGPANTHLVEQFWHLGDAVMRDLLHFPPSTEDSAETPPGISFVPDSWTSPVYGAKLPATVLRVRRTGSFPLQLVAWLDTTGSTQGISLTETEIEIRTAQGVERYLLARAE